MRKKITLAAAALALAAGLTACSAGADAGTSSSPSSSASSSSSDSRTGMFAGLNGKKVSGTVSISGGTLTLAGFSSDEGPDLHVYLTSGTDEAAVGAGKAIKVVAFDKADQTFSLSGIDSSSYTDVVIHCDKAKAVFGAATLS